MRNMQDTLDLKQLKCFLAVAQFGSLTRAGIELGISESAVAQRLKAFEKHLGEKLYEAPGGRVRLTTVGEHVRNFAMTLFDQVEAFQTELLSGEVSQKLRVAAEESTLLYLLPSPIQHFTEAHPKVRLEVLSRTPTEIVSLAQKGEIDIGIVSYLPTPESIMFRPWQEFPGYLITPLGHPLLKKRPLVLEEILKYRLILPERDMGIYERVRETLETKGLGFEVSIEVGAWETVKHYVARGLGISVVSGICLTEADRSRLEAIEIPDEFAASTSYGVIMRRDKYIGPVHRMFLESLDPKLA